eukprot:249330-Pleurochrysis_carterae.AAC.1
MVRRGMHSRHRREWKAGTEVRHDERGGDRRVVNGGDGCEARERKRLKVFAYERFACRRFASKPFRVQAVSRRALCEALGAAGRA